MPGRLRTNGTFTLLLVTALFLANFNRFTVVKLPAYPIRRANAQTLKYALCCVALAF